MKKKPTTIRAGHPVTDRPSALEGPSRRAVVGASALAVPAIVMMTTTPAFANSATPNRAVTVKVTPSSVRPGGTGAVSGIVSESGVAKAGVLVTLSSSDAHVSFSSTTVTSASDGTYSADVTVSGSDQGTATLTATSGSVSASTSWSWSNDEGYTDGGSPTSTNLVLPSTGSDGRVYVTSPSDWKVYAADVNGNIVQEYYLGNAYGLSAATAFAGYVWAAVRFSGSPTGAYFRVKTTADGNGAQLNLGAGPHTLSRVGDTVYVACAGAKALWKGYIQTQLNNAPRTAKIVDVPAGAVGVAAAPNESFVAVCSGASGGAVSIVSPGSSSVSRVVTAGNAPVDAAVKGDSSQLYVVNSVDQTLSVFETTNWGLIKTLPVTGANLAGVRWSSAQGGRVIITDVNGKVYAVDPAAWTVVNVASVGMTAQNGCLALSSDGSMGYVAGSSGLKTVNLFGAGSLPVTNRATGPSALLSPSFADGFVYVSAPASNAVVTLNNAGSIVGSTPNSYRVRAATAAGDYRFAAVNLTGWGLRVTYGSNTYTQNAPLGNDPRAVVGVITGSSSITGQPPSFWAFVPCAGSNALYRVNSRSGGLPASTSLGSLAGAVDVATTSNKTNAYVASGTSSGIVSVVDMSAMTLKRTFTTGNTPVQSAVSPDNARVYVANGPGRTLAVFETTTFTQIKSVTVPGADLTSVQLTPDGSQAVVVNAAGDLFLVDTSTWAVVKIGNIGDTTSGLCLAVSADGKKAYVTGATTSQVVTVKIG